MALESRAKEVKYGSDIIAFRSQLQGAQNTISSVKANITAMRAEILREYGDPSEELTEVDAFDAAAFVGIKTFVASL